MKLTWDDDSEEEGEVTKTIFAVFENVWLFTWWHSMKYAQMGLKMIFLNMLKYIT